MRNEAPLLITLEDLQGVFKKHKKTLYRFALVGTVLGVIFCLSCPLKFRAQATFKEGANLSSSVNLSQLFSTNILEKQEHGAQFLMRSEAVLRKAVEKMGFQVHVKGYDPSSSVGHLFDNALYSLSGVVVEPKKFVFSDVQYEGRKEKKMLLVVKEDLECYFFDEKKQFLAKGKIGQPIEGIDFCLTLKNLPPNFRKESPYRLTLSPWAKEVAKLKRHFEVRQDKKDRQILWLYFEDRDAEIAAKTVNQIAESFLAYLKEEEEKLVHSQIAHLDERRKKLEEDFDETLSAHTDTFKKCIADSGFVEVKQHLELIQKPLLSLQEKMVELGTLENSLKETQAAYAKAMGFPHSMSKGTVAANTGELFFPFLESARFWPQQFAGIDLATAKDLHATYQRRLDEIESNLDRIAFILPKIPEEGFDLHSIGLLAQDEVAEGLAHEASKLALSLRDVNNYSQKDQQRLNESLKSQKRFIQAHLEQTSELYTKQASVLQSKLASLRSAMLKLVENETKNVQEQLHRFQVQLAQLPDQWRLEKILEAKSAMMKKVVEGVSQVIEGKIAEHHLKTIGSKMIDAARIPEVPSRPSLLGISFLLGCVSFILAYAVFFSRALWKGLPLTCSAARSLGLTNGGILSIYSDCPFEELPKEDLEISRKIGRFIEEKEKPLRATCVAVAGKQQKGWIENLAGLLALQDKRVLVVDVSFPAWIPATESVGLLQFLQGKMPMWDVQRKKDFDFLPSGGTTKYVTEIFQGDKFDRFLEEAKQRYERILLMSETSLDASENQLLIEKCDLCVAFISEESYDCLVQSGITKQHDKMIYLWTEKYT